MDHVSKAVRSKIMASVGSKGNRTTELRLGKIIWDSGLRGYRKHWAVTGHPDFAWPGLKIAVFVDGCFWHGCPRCKRVSHSNSRFWRDKVLTNQARDRRVSAKLRRDGWIVVRVWECQVTSIAAIHRITKAVLRRRK